MSVMKSLTLAVVTGLFLGVGAATVQEGGTVFSVAASRFYRATQAAGGRMVQSGASDVDTIHPESPGVHTDLFTF